MRPFIIEALAHRLCRSVLVFHCGVRLGQLSEKRVTDFAYKADSSTLESPAMEVATGVYSPRTRVYLSLSTEVMPLFQIRMCNNAFRPEGVARQ